MAIGEPQAVSVTTDPTPLSSEPSSSWSAAAARSRPGSRICVYNNGAETVFLGNDAVTTATGLPLAAGASFEDTLEAGEVLYGIVAAGTEECRVYEGGV